MLGLLIGYLFLFIHRPFEIWPVLADFRLELLYMLGAGSIWLASPKRLPANSLVMAVFALAGAALLSSLLSPWSERCLEDIEPHLKFLIFVLMLVTSIRSEVELRRLIIGFLAAMMLYMLHSLWEFHSGRYVVRMGIVRLLGVDKTGGDPNTFASSILLALVLVPALWRGPSSLGLRCFLAGFVALAFLCIGLTGSRAAFLGLVVFLTVTVWQSAWRGRLALLVVLAAPLLFLALPETLQNRFETIVNPGAGPANARLSGQARIDGLKIGIQLWLDNPLTGVGPGAWRPATGRPLEAHNLYGQLLGELGTVGALAFAAILLGYIRNLLQVRRTYRDQGWQPDFVYHLAHSIGLAVFLLLLAGNFGHNLFRYNWALYAAFMVSAWDCVAQQRAQFRELIPDGDAAADYTPHPAPSWIA